MNIRSRGRPRVTGGEVMRQAIGYVQILGLGSLVRRQNTGVGEYANKDGTTRKVRYGNKGDLDLDGMLPDGRRFSYEAKATGELPTGEQFAAIQTINANGGVAFWSDNLDVFIEIMGHVLAGAKVRYLTMTKAEIIPRKQRDEPCPPPSRRSLN